MLLATRKNAKPVGMGRVARLRQQRQEVPAIDSVCCGAAVADWSASPLSGQLLVLPSFRAYQFAQGRIEQGGRVAGIIRSLLC